MSRIAGLVQLSCDDGIKSRLFSSMHSKGYSDQKCTGDDLCNLLYCGRKSQCTCLKWGGERYSIVMDGTLYNTAELIQQLKILGHCFDEHTDADIVLHAYAQWGADSVEKLLGVFSFAIWHECARILFIARDQMGVKPLFYATHRHGFIFSSEIKTILSYPTVTARIDGNAVAQIMLIGPGRIPGSGVFKGVYELEPGCYGVYSDQQFHKKRYWTLQDREHHLSFDETAEEVHSLVMDSIKKQTDYTDSFGAFLSGGLDSSVISAVGASVLREKGRILNTFSVDYTDNDKHFVSGKFQPERDNDYIEIMRRYLCSNHHWTILDPQNLIDCIETATVARDLPGMGDVDFSLLAFCEQIKQHVDIALSGECADEIFGGYPWFTDIDIHPLNSFPWSANIEFRASFINKTFLINANEFVMDHLSSCMAQCDILPECSGIDRKIKEMTWLNHHWFMQTLIDRNDRMSMESGLEIRAPFCDHRIATYMYAVPWTYKYYGNREKGLLRYAMKGVVPDEILWRKKSPYPKTYDPQYTNVVREMLAQLINDQHAPLWEIADRETARGLLIGDLQQPWYGQLMKGPQTMAYMLQINFWLKNYNVKIM